MEVPCIIVELREPCELIVNTSSHILLIMDRRQIVFLITHYTHYHVAMSVLKVNIIRENIQIIKKTIKIVYKANMYLAALSMRYY